MLTTLVKTCDWCNFTASAQPRFCPQCGYDLPETSERITVREARERNEWYFSTPHATLHPGL